MSRYVTKEFALSNPLRTQLLEIVAGSRGSTCADSRTGLTAVRARCSGT